MPTFKPVHVTILMIFTASQFAMVEAGFALGAAIAKLVSYATNSKPLPHADAATESLGYLVDHRDSKLAGSEAAPESEPILTIKFGTKDSPVPEGQYKDYGLPYQKHPALGLSWGWNCDLDSLEGARERTRGGSDLYLRSFVIPDRHAQCQGIETPIWRISLPAGEYTVRVR